MRISDWSSDVCSSDLALHLLAEGGVLAGHRAGGGDREGVLGPRRRNVERQRRDGGQHGQDRKSVVMGKSVSVRVDLGGRRIIKKHTFRTSLLHIATQSFTTLNTNESILPHSQK